MASVALIIGCNLANPVEGLDGRVADGGTEAMPEAAADASPDVDHDGLTGAGPVTFVTNDIALVVDRMCDLDGDGEEDNAVADLGGAEATLFASVTSAAFQAEILPSGSYRLVIHVPFVEDRETMTDAEVVAVTFDGMDLDDPPDGEDDFDGDEPLAAHRTSLDGCGEPRSVFREARIDDGRLAAEQGTIPFRFEAGDDPEARSRLEIRDAAAEGTIARGGAGLEMRVCGRATIGELGGVAASVLEEDLSLLEVFVSGGQILGMPAVPGLDPDLDLDGDGLERIVVDASGRIESCLDGDGASIVGRDCWQDERMADGFAITIGITGVPARFAGLDPRRDYPIEGECDEPPDPSLWDPI